MNTGEPMSPNEEAKKKQYYTIEEVETLLKKSRATIYNRMNLIGLKTHKFPYDKKAYVAAADIEYIEAVFEQPWSVEEIKKRIAQRSDSSAA